MVTYSCNGYNFKVSSLVMVTTRQKKEVVELRKQPFLKQVENTMLYLKTKDCQKCAKRLVKCKTS